MYDPMVNYSDLMNNKMYTVHIPEYYEPQLPDYYRRPARTLPPIVNGVPVTMEEYLEKDPEFVPDKEFLPEIIHKYGEMDMTYANLSIAGIIDLMENKVPFSMDDISVIPEILLIIDNYIIQIRPYMSTNEKVRKFVDKIGPIKAELESIYTAIMNRVNRDSPFYKPPPYTLGQLIKFVYPGD